MTTSSGQGRPSPFEDSAFSGIFLGYCIGALVLSVFFLSYFNRAFASLISVVIRAYAWRAYGIYIDIQALQISLLGGRIFFTRLRYHGDNETILIHKGYITWSYWQWRVRDVGIYSAKDDEKAEAEGKDKDKRKTKLPCRVNVVVSGVEWFVYNRSGAYEAVLEGMLGSLAEDSGTVIPQEEDGPTKLRKRTPRSTGDAPSDSTVRNSAFDPSSTAEEGSFVESARRKMTSGTTFGTEVAPNQSPEDELPLLLQFFPIHLQCSKVGVVMGNENTKAIMIIKAKGLEGEIDAVSTDTPDPYREVYKMKFDNPVIEFRDNDDYKEDQVDKAVREKQVAKETEPLPRRSILRMYRRKALNQLRDMVPFWQSSVGSFAMDERLAGTTADRGRPGSNHWQGLTRYLDDLERNEHLRWASVEYAAVNTILDSPEATFTIYWDTPGLVVPRRPATSEKLEARSNINGDVPPAWGIKLAIKGGTVNYGPWADRHRAEIQRVFFPGLCKDSQPAKPLPIGASRMPTQFKLYVELDDQVTLRVPIKEESKNWKFRGNEPVTKTDKARDNRKTRGRHKQAEPSAPAGHDRQYGWLDVKVAANSTVSYQSDMVAGSNGFSSFLTLDFPGTEISSSINHEVLWRSKRLGTSCDLSTPLKWNGLRQWKFDITTDDLDLFILRDHIFLITDLVTDWSDGPPPEYLTFTPFKYFLDLHFRNLKLYLNVNDGNIINKPTDLDDNAYIIIKSPLLDSSTCIALDKYRPAKSVIAFDARTDEAFIGIHVPPWNTQASFLKSMDMGHLENLIVDGKYHFNAITSPATTDTLVLNVSGQSPVFHLYGFVIRYFLKVKDNYFGDDVHFKTLEEYQELLELKKTDPDAELRTKAPPKKSNDMDVILSIKADDPKMFLPANLYSSTRNIQIDGTSLGADLRFTNYYMDLDLTLSPLHLSLGHGDGGQDTPMSASSATELFVDGLTMYGHRVFGLPPVEPTYLCNWDLSVGAVTGECSAPFLTALMSGGKAFGLTFDDDENALIPFSDTVVYDVTFLRVFVQSVKLWLRVDEAAFLLSTGSIDVSYNDWARTHYSKRANIKIPDIELSCVSGDSITRHRARSHEAVDTDLMIRTTVHLATVARKFDFSNERRLQQELIRNEDQRVIRTPFLVLPELSAEHVAVAVDPPAQSVPPVPQPTLEQDVPVDRVSLSSSGSSIRSRGPKYAASFLSMSSSSSGSVIRPKSKRSSMQSRYPEGLRRLTPAENRLSGQQDLHRRQISASSDRRSAFYSAYGDIPDTQDQAHNTVAFSSQYFAPYFPLETVVPDSPHILVPSIEVDEGNGSGNGSAATTFDLGDIDPNTLKEDRAYSSTLVELPDGLTGFVNPAALKNVAALITALQPSEPEDVLDTLQEEALSDIFGKKQKRNIKGTISDLHLRLPRVSLRFVNSSQLDSSEPPQEEQDQYDFSLNDLVLTTRDETTWEDAFDAASFQSKKSFHVRLGLFELSAAEHLASRPDPQAAVKAQIQNVLASMGTKDVTYLDGDVGNINCSLSSKELEYMASLVHRTAILVTELGKVFASTSREAELKKYLAYRLVNDGHGAIDPIFLIRPSAVLRSATDHIRTYDSWKLISRLRQTWMTLDTETRDQLRLDCLGPTLDVPVDARLRTLTGFESWRSWDLHNTNGSELIQHIFGNDGSVGSSSSDADTPFLAVLRLRDTRFVLDPGPKQNEIVIIDVTARYQDRPPRDVEVNSNETSEAAETSKTPDTVETPETPGTTETPETPKTEAEVAEESIATVNIYCSEAALKLTWDLLELGEDMLKLYTKWMKTEGKPATEDAQPPKSPKPLTKRIGKSLQVALAVSRGEVAFDAINLNAATLANGLKASLLVRNESSDVSDTNLIIGCAAVTSRIRSHGQVLGVFQLRDPAVVISHTLEATQDTDRHTIKGSASSKEASMAIQQDPVALLEVVDLLIRDEAAQLFRLQAHLPSSPQPAAPKPKIVDRLSSFRVNVAMFLDEYYISVPLLQSLTYCVSGVVARAAVAANFGKELIFDFDVKENSHEIQIKVNTQARSLSLLQIPPLNGRIQMRTSDGQNIITTSASVELVTFDASAVYSLLRALNRPEVTSTVNDIQEQVQAIQANIRETFKKAEPKPTTPQAAPVERAPKPPNALVYEVHVTSEGLVIFGNSPLKSETEPLAHIMFGLGRVHWRMTNRPSTSRPILDNPEVYVNMQQIEWKIERGTEGNFRTCGKLAFGALVTATAQVAADGSEQRHFNITTDGFDVVLSPETISTSVDVIGYMNDKIKDLDTSRELELLRKLRQTKPKIMINDETPTEQEEADFFDSFLTSIRYNFEIRRMQVVWLVLMEDEQPSEGKEDLVFTWDKIELGTRTRNSARLSVENFQVQMVPTAANKRMRSANSALMPEVVFNVAYVSTAHTRRMAFQAVGKSLDLRLTSGFIIPMSNVVDSIQLSVKNIRQATEHWAPPATRRPSQPAELSTEQKAAEPRQPMLGNKRLESLLLDADFAGAVVYLAAKKDGDDPSQSSRNARPGLAGKYGQFSTDGSGSGTLLKSPGIAFKVEYRDPGKEDPSLYGELKIDASSNTLYPSFVPLVMDLTSSIKEVVSNDNDSNTQPQQTLAKTKTAQEEYLLDPSAVIGRLKLNLGLRVRKQEFTMSCQPIARVAATASFDDVYFTVNTVASADQGKFFAIAGIITNLRSSVRHVYSREETGQFNVHSIVLSLMNSKHVSGISGVSAILKFSPMDVSINAKQLQDFLLFREIWAPRDVRQQTTTQPVAKTATDTSQGVLVQRYQQVAATAAFPWTATISVAALKIDVDLGQAIGKSKFVIEEFWVSSKKTSDWEQNLCLGFQRIAVESQGRMSGFVALQDFQLRTSIQWPEREQALNETPMVQASVTFSQFRVKAAFDYQAFLVADITTMNFLMYNVRRTKDGAGNRLVATIDGDAVQIFGTTTSAAQGIALYQAFQKLIQERKASFETSLREIEKFMKRKSGTAMTMVQRPSIPKAQDDDVLSKAPISLDTDVVVTFKALNLGIFPSTFSDHQVFKAEALNAQARFAASLDKRRIHSILGLTVGQLRIGLASVRTAGAPKALSELAVEDVVASATGSRGGTILKVPKVEAVMQTWQTPNSREIDYIFKSAFEGKVEVGWNYSRISYIRDMWANHSRSLAQAYGKELVGPIKVTGVLPDTSASGSGSAAAAAASSVAAASSSSQQQQPPAKDDGGAGKKGEGSSSSSSQGKITAKVDLPQSKYEYRALVPPIIETPQLRDMGEATPPLEWIGLHRERLPNLTHQIVIVSLLELAGEVEDAYSRILGSS